MSGLKRFFVDKINKYVTVSGDEFLHAINVLRIKVGEEIVLLDNTVYEYVAKVIEINKRDFVVEVLEKKKNINENRFRIKLICGYLKGDKTELVVQKAVELGITEIAVFESKFSSSYLSDNKTERLIKVAKEACKQCGRSIAPNIMAYKDLKSALLSGNDYENKIFACEFAEKSDVDLHSIKGDTAVVVGSEGGFSEEEFSEAINLGFKGITLGNRILRAETACITLCGILSFLNGELDK